MDVYYMQNLLNQICKIRSCTIKMFIIFFIFEESIGLSYKNFNDDFVEFLNFLLFCRLRTKFDEISLFRTDLFESEMS